MVMSRMILLILLFPMAVAGQDRYFVSFKDKANTPYSVSSPLQFLSQKSIDRRVRENFTITEEDFPPNIFYINDVKATGASVFYSSRWFNGVLVQTDAATASAIAALSFVSKVTLVAPGAKLTGGRQAASNKME